MRKFINILILTIALIGAVSAQSLDDLSKKVFDLSFEIINKGMNRMSAYEEHLEKQELEAAKKAEEERKAEEEAKKAEEEEALEAKKAEDDKFVENCNILVAVAIYFLLDHDKAWVKCYCYPLRDYVWYKIFFGDDNDWWINLAYDNNDEIGDVFYARKTKNLDFIKVKDDISGKETAAIKLTTDDDDHIGVIQDIYDPKTFMLTW